MLNLKANILLLFCCSTLPSFVASQTIAEISNTICDSLQSVEYTDENQLYMAQLGIYANEVMKYPTLRVDITEMNKPHQFNEFNYKINRQLIRTCPAFRDQFTLLPLSKILDLETVFNSREYDSLESAAVSFVNALKMNLVIVSLDDPFPFKDLSTYAKAQAIKWNVGSRYERGGIFLVFSQQRNDVSIALVSKNGGITENPKFQGLIEPPFFKDGNNRALDQVLEYVNLLRKNSADL